MSVFLNPISKLHELLNSRSDHDTARRVRESLEQAAASRRLPWELDEPAPLHPLTAPEDGSTLPFGISDRGSNPRTEGLSSGVEATHAHTSLPAAQESGLRQVAPEHVTELLRRGPSNRDERRLLAKLFAVAVIQDWPSDLQTLIGLVRRMNWLALKADVNPFPWLDEGLGADERAELWATVGERVRNGVAFPDDTGRLETVAAAWQLSQGRSPDARRAAAEAAVHASDNWLRTMLAAGSSPGVLEGGVGPTPRGPVATAIMAFTLVLFFSRLGALVGRWTLAYRRPARLRLAPEGLELEQRTELLGRVLRERRHFVSLNALSSITRETRFSNLGLYVGLGSLVVGTFLGSGLLVDGMRVSGGSGPLVTLGLAIVLLGLVLDLGISLLDSRRSNQCHVIIRPVRGRAFCISGVDARSADALLSDVKTQLHP